MFQGVRSGRWKQPEWTWLGSCQPPRCCPYPLFPPLVIDPHWVPEEMKEKMDLIISPVSSDDRSTTCYFKVDLHRITVSAFGLVACVVRLFLASSWTMFPSSEPLYTDWPIRWNGKLRAPREYLQVVSVLLSRERQGKLLIQSVA